MADSEQDFFMLALDAFIDPSGDLNSAGGFAIGSIMTFIGVLVTSVISYILSSWQLKASHVQKVSEFRQKWIHDVRNTVAMFTHYSNQLKDDNKSENDISAWKALTEIRLLLNPKEDPHKNLEEAMQKLLNAASNDVGSYQEKLLDVQNAANIVLKKEWKRVKDDLRAGKI